MPIMDFGHNSFVAVKGLKERIQEAEKENQMPDPEYICLSCGETYAEGHTFCCNRCGAEICPKCGGDMTTIKEYDEATRVNSRES